MSDLQPGLTSIVLIAYNGLHWTRRAVQAILNHTGPPYELLLVDNGSTDGTGDYFRELAAQHSHVTAILKERNYGGYARTFGMQVARGEFLAWVDNDAEVGEGWLDRLLSTLQDPTVGATGPEGVAFRENWNHLFHTKGWPPERAVGQNVDVLVGYCLVMRNLVRYIGFLDPAFYPAWNEEADYCLRIKLLGYRLVVTPVPVVHHEHKTGFPGVTDVRTHIGRLNRVLIEKWDPFKRLVLEIYRREGPGQ